jgi:DNA-directed RNA polymerase
MDFSESPRALQRRRERLLLKEDYDVFKNYLEKKDPTNTNSKIKSSSVWEKELGPFYNEIMKTIPSIIKKEIDVKFKHIGLATIDDDHKEAYKQIILGYVRLSVVKLVFISLAITFDACLLKAGECDGVSYQHVVDKIAREIFRQVNDLLQNKKISTKKKNIIILNPGVVINVRYEAVKEDFYHIAGYFLDKVISNQNVLIMYDRKHLRDVHRLCLSEEVARYYDPEKTKGRLFRPTKYPMICEPDKWNNNLVGGGYLIKYNNEFLFNVKSLKHKKLIYDAFSSGGSQKIFLKAINSLQQTPWRINDKVLSVMEHFHSADSYDGDIAKRLLYDQTVNFASDLKGGVFYIPWYLDFRGRMYPSVLHVSPQSHDGGRSLLNFAEPMEITRDNEEHSLKNLAVFGYNKYDPRLGKVSRDGMISWIESNQNEIFECAKNPIDNFEFWQKASDSYSFLAFCFEWFDVKQSRHGQRYTRLPVYVDGTCNGFQHYSALLRDHMAGPLVNLADNDVPGDFYQTVVDKLHQLVNADTFTDSSVKCLVLEFVDRAFIKKSIIAAGYGAGNETRAATMFTNLRDALQVRFNSNSPYQLDFAFDRKIKTEQQPLYKKALIVEKQIDAAIQEICPSFVRSKEWLNDVNKIFNENKECLFWTNPAGVPVFNFYYHFPVNKISLFMNGKPHKFQFRNYESTAGLLLRKKKTSSSISPNYIHSLDAGHAANVIVKYVKSTGKGSQHWIASVHDSFACHATNIDRLQNVIRETFYRMHSENQLEIFKSQVEERFKVSLPDLPEFGKLDLREVLKSTYFFC